MAFTNITSEKVTLDDGQGGPADAYFHLRDISILLNQPGVEAVQVVKAVVGGKECTAMVGVTAFDTTGVSQRLDQENDLIILSCPPYLDQEGGNFEPLT
jgi:hypothetical protein